MANTKITTNVIADDAVTSDKLGGDLTMPGHVSLTDSGELRLGTGNDLVIKHNGSNASITNGTGHLTLRGATVYIADQANNEYMAQFIANGAASLRYDNTEQLATVSGGVYVPNKLGIGDNAPFSALEVNDTDWSSGSPYGTVAYIEGGATHDLNWGHLVVSQSGTTTDTGGRISLGANGQNPIAGIRAKYKGATYGDLAFLTRPSGGTNTERMVITSAGNVGIGINPSNTFSVGASGTVTTRYTSTDTNAFSLLMFENSGSIVFSADHGDAQGASSIIFKNDGAQERMKIDVGGHVGIATNVEADGTAMTSPLTVGAHNYGGNVFEAHRTANSIHRQYMSTGGKSYLDIYGTSPSLQFRIAGADIAEMVSTGLKFTSGKGIDFSSAADISTGETVTSSVLDDYEEGTFTPVITTAGGNYTSGAQSPLGYYTRIGRYVHIALEVSISSSQTISGGSGDFMITGLPYDPIMAAVGNCTTGRVDNPPEGTWQAYIGAGNTTVKLRAIGDYVGGDSDGITVAQASIIHGNTTPWFTIYIDYQI